MQDLLEMEDGVPLVEGKVWNRGEEEGVGLWGEAEGILYLGLGVEVGGLGNHSVVEVGLSVEVGMSGR